MDLPEGPIHLLDRWRSLPKGNLRPTPKKVGGVSGPAGPTLVPIAELNLSVRSSNALSHYRVSTIGDLARLTDKELLKFKNFGRKSLAEVREALSKFFAANQLPESTTEGMGATSEPSNSDKKPWSVGGWLIRCDGAEASEARIGERLSDPIDVLDLSTRPANVLKRLGIHRIGDLLEYPKRQLRSAENVGAKSVREIEEKISLYLSLGAVSTSESPAKPEETALGTRAFVEAMLALLSERQAGVIKDRYGLGDGVPETLQDIGDKLSLTRERIRQIEDKSLKRLRRVFGWASLRNFVLNKMETFLSCRAEELCGVITEDELGAAFADDCSTEEAVLSLSLFRDINASFFSGQMSEAEPGVYCLDKALAKDYRSALETLMALLARSQKPLSEKHCYDAIAGKDSESTAKRRLARRILDVSPSIARLQNGTVVLSEWREFGRRDAGNLAAATLRLLGRAAHFREIADKTARFFPEIGKVNERVLHAALLRYPEKFVWVKSGTYGLHAWGLSRPPFLKDRLIQLLSHSPYPLPYWHLKEKALEVCNCKESSVRMTLDLNPRIFKKFDDDQYGLREHFEA